jgi:hypothetical protein
VLKKISDYLRKYLSPSCIYLFFFEIVSGLLQKVKTHKGEGLCPPSSTLSLSLSFSLSVSLLACPGARTSVSVRPVE